MLIVRILEKYTYKEMKTSKTLDKSITIVSSNVIFSLQINMDPSWFILGKTQAKGKACLIVFRENLQTVITVILAVDAGCHRSEKNYDVI